MNPLLQVHNIEKRYGARIGCADVSFDLYPAKSWGLWASLGQASPRCSIALRGI